MKKKRSIPRLKVYDEIRKLSTSDLCYITQIDGKLYIPLEMYSEEKYENYSVDTYIEKDYGCYGYGQSETTGFVIYGIIDESDAEYEKRIELDEKANKHKEEEKQKERDKELAELQRLKKKYENN